MSIKFFIVSNIPNAHTKSIQHPAIPAIPIRVLILFLIISLIFHFEENPIFLNIPFVVIFKLFFFIFGISVLNVSAGLSFSSLLHVIYVTSDTISTTTIATKKLLFETAAFPFGT